MCSVPAATLSVAVPASVPSAPVLPTGASSSLTSTAASTAASAPSEKVGTRKPSPRALLGREIRRRDDLRSELDEAVNDGVVNHCRLLQLAATIKNSANALVVIKATPHLTAEYGMAIQDERAAGILSRLPAVLLWRRSPLLQALKPLCTLSVDKGGEASYAGVQACGVNDELIRKLQSDCDGWCDPTSVPKCPNDRELERRWYRSKGYKGYRDWERRQIACGYVSDDDDARDRAYGGCDDDDDYNPQDDY
jgi:hypothetical protein